MRSLNMTEPFNAMQLLFSPPFAVSEAMSRNAGVLRENQAKSLDAMQRFANGWFERRHAGIRATAEAAERMSRAATPVDLLREYQNWASGVLQRAMVDGLACQQQIVTAAGTAVMPRLADGKEGASSQTETRPAVFVAAARAEQN
jgi:hypothetical protein